MLDALTGTLKGGAPLLSETLGGFIPESEVAGLLRETEKAHPACQIGSYPFFREGKVGSNFRDPLGPMPKRFPPALARSGEGLDAAGFAWEPGGVALR